MSSSYSTASNKSSERGCRKLLTSDDRWNSFKHAVLRLRRAGSDRCSVARLTLCPPHYPPRLPSLPPRSPDQRLHASSGRAFDMIPPVVCESPSSHLSYSRSGYRQPLRCPDVRRLRKSLTYRLCINPGVPYGFSFIGVPIMQ